MARVVNMGMGPRDSSGISGIAMGADAINRVARVDSDLMDAAVDEALKGETPERSALLKRLWSMDNGEVAGAYFKDRLRQRLDNQYGHIGKREFVVRERLTEEEAVAVTKYAPEFDFKFQESVPHEHAFYSVRRAIDHELLVSNIPSGLKYIDFGGSVRYHVRKGNTNVVVVAPFDIDYKDRAREALTRLTLGRLKNDPKASMETREMARSVCAEENTYHVRTEVSRARVQALRSIAVHVYDVPLSQWPKTMERCGVETHVGVLHFDNAFFHRDSGTFTSTGAMYEIDRERDVLRMRVAGSSAPWYEHKWSEYWHYGANQVIRTENNTYSYQILERRQDTIFYRIAKVSSATMMDRDQVYALPEVPMAIVTGFEVNERAKPGGMASRCGLVRRQYHFPQVLWERMVGHAGKLIATTGLSCERMFNYYRTAVPRQSVNGVHTSGGQAVPSDQVPALVAMAAAVAFVNSWKQTRTIRELTDAEQTFRLLEGESTVYKACCAFFDTFVALGHVAVSPFSLNGFVSKLHARLVDSQMVTWEPEVRIRSLSMALIVDHKTLGYSVKSPDSVILPTSSARYGMVEQAADIVRHDPVWSAKILSECGDDLKPSVRKRLQEVSASATVLPTDGSTTAVDESLPEREGTTESWVDGRLVRRTVRPRVSAQDRASYRRSTIAEAVEECNLEIDANVSTCRRVFADVMIAGRVDKKVLVKRREENFNADIWAMRDGAIVPGSSVLDPSQEFTHGGVYVPGGGRNDVSLYPVLDELWEGTNQETGLHERRVHKKIPIDYTGSVLVMDSLKIFNGPAVVDALERALRLGDESFQYTVEACQGPPGCGKTTTVVREGRLHGDKYLVPVKLSAEDLKKKLIEQHSVSERQVTAMCSTLDSLLVNYSTLREAAKSGFERLLADEYVITRGGKWHAAAALLGVDVVLAYGDSKQLGHGPRVDAPVNFLAIEEDVLKEEFVTHRCAAELLACFGYVYANKVRTTNLKPGSVKRFASLDQVQFEKDTLLCTMYQADKKLLKEYVMNMTHKPRVCTVHEAQGSAHDMVVLFNGDIRKRDHGDQTFLYNVERYALVAISRGRFKFAYVKQSEEPDLVTEMMERSKDVRRVEAAKELATQGYNNLIGV